MDGVQVMAFPDVIVTRFFSIQNVQYHYLKDSVSSQELLQYYVL